MTLRRIALPILVLAIALTGCTAEPAPTPSPTQAETAAPTPVETTTAPEPSAAPAATCDDIFTAEAYDKLAADGLAPLEPGNDHTDFTALMVERGAVGCTWGKPQTDIMFWAAQLPVDDAEWAEWSTALADAGYTQTDSPVPGSFEGPENGSGIAPVVVHGDDVLTFVSVPEFAGWIAPRA